MLTGDFNPNHDPDNGQFTEASGGSRSKVQEESSGREESHKGNIRNTEIARSRIYSPEYAHRIGKLEESPKVKRLITEHSRSILEHRSGTKYEDMVYIDSITGEICKRTDYDVERQVDASEKMKRMAKRIGPDRIIAIHNHSGSSVPSTGDIGTLVLNKHKYGLVVCHNGDIYKYSAGKNPNIAAYNTAIKDLDNHGYSKTTIQQFIADAKKADIFIEEL